MATIQIKHGTGSAVPSSLLSGELAINIDSGALYYGTSGSSNAVSSSFFFHNVTASGTVKAATLDATAISDGLAAAIVAEIDNDEIPIAKLAEDSVTVTSGTNLSGGGSVTLGSSITLNVDDAFLKNDADDTTTGKLTTAGLNSTSHITSSGNVSSSSTTSTFTAATGSYDILQGDTTQPTSLYVDGHITASGEIKAEHLYSTDDAQIDDDLTVEGDINAKGNIVGDDDTDITNIETIECDNVVHDGDTDTKMAFGTDEITFKVGNIDMLELTEISSTEQRISFDGNITHSGDISSSGIMKMGLPGARQDHYVYGRLNVIGSDVIIGDGHITASGNISASAGSTGSFSHIITSTGSIEFRDGSSKVGFLKFNSSDGLQVENADRTGHQPLKVGDLTAVDKISGQHITASGNISSSAGTVITSRLKGSTTGDQSGSLYLSGSLTFRDNAAIPAVSASTLYDHDGHLYYGGGLVGGYHLSASVAGNDPTIGYIKILPQDWIASDGASSSTLYYNAPVLEDDTSAFGVKTNQSTLDLYAMKDIPYGWTVIGFRLFGVNGGGSADTITFHVYDMTDGSRTADGNTGTVAGAEITLATPTRSTATNYFGLKVNPDNTTDVVTGGYIKIERRG